MTNFNLENAVIEIRISSQEDYWFCYNLNKRNMSGYITKYWGGWNPKIFRKDFKLENIELIIQKKKRIGYLDVQIRDKSLYLNNVQLSNLMRGKGIGSFLMKYIEDKAKQNNKAIIQLEVFKDNPAKRLYERLGYSIIEDKKTSVIMEKKVF